MKRPNSGRGRQSLSANRRPRRTLADGRAIRPAPEALEPRELLAAPVVSVGKVVTATEGFGYGSTIDGFGSSLDLGATAGSPTVGLTTPFGIAQTRAFTQEFWIFPKSGADGSVYRTSNASGRLTEIAVRSGRNLEVTGGFAGGTFTLANALTADAWNHVAQTYDGTTYRVYVNGVEQLNSKAFAGQPVAEPDQLQIGVTANQPGVLDELRFWSVARTPAEIQKALTELPAKTEPGLVGYYQFDGNLSDTTGRNAQFAVAGSPVFSASGSALGTALDLPRTTSGVATTSLVNPFGFARTKQYTQEFTIRTGPSSVGTIYQLVHGAGPALNVAVANAGKDLRIDSLNLPNVLKGTASASTRWHFRTTARR